MGNGLTPIQATEVMRLMVNEEPFPENTKALGKQLMDDYFVTKKTLLLLSEQLKSSHKMLQDRSLRANAEVILTARIRQDTDILAQAQAGGIAVFNRIVILNMDEKKANGRIFYDIEGVGQGKMVWAYQNDKVFATRMEVVE